MDILKKYTIPYKGLSIGNHHFNFEIDNRFFEAFEGSEVDKGNVLVDINLNRQNNMLVLNFDIKGEVMVTCDRCLEDCPMPINYQSELIVRFSETEQESDNDIIWISPAESEVSLAQWIYESILLSLPYQRVHGTDEQGNSLCNPDMLDRFKIISAEEFDRMAQEQEQDSPWGKLEELREKLKNEEEQ